MGHLLKGGLLNECFQFLNVLMEHIYIFTFKVLCVAFGWPLSAQSFFEEGDWFSYNKSKVSPPHSTFHDIGIYVMIVDEVVSNYIPSLLNIVIIS